jgi:hypothetical protein
MTGVFTGYRYRPSEPGHPGRGQRLRRELRGGSSMCERGCFLSPKINPEIA